MYVLATFLIVALVSLFVTRLATGFLIATGMPPHVAAFQARSAFTGAGFTTTESENVVNHPVRRRVISWTMFAGNLGIPTLVVTVVVGLVGQGVTQFSTRLIVLVAGIALVVLIAFLRPVTRLFVDLGRRAAQPVLKRAFEGKVEDLVTLGAGVQLVAVTLSGKLPLRSLAGLQNALPEVRVVGMRPQGDADSFVTGHPTDVDLTEGDQLILAADRDVLTRLLPALSDQRPPEEGPRLS